MKRFLLLVFFFLALSIFMGGWFYQNCKPYSETDSYQDFLITKGSSAGEIGKKLQSEGLIRSALAFKFYVRFSGKSQKIQAGEYRLSPHFSLFRIVGELLKGPVEIWVTIPEGFRREEAAEKFAKALGKDDAFILDFLTLTKGKEGYLFPDTYLFPKEITAEKIVVKMIATFDQKAGVMIDREDIILASLVERETKTAEERPIVAGILLNRIEIGMPLQVDATIQYVKGSWGTVYTNDRKIKSPHNTYLNRGLPPGPICSPGLSSIKAVLAPAETDHFYYLHDAKGEVHYAETLEEHNTNIARYLK